MAFGVSFTLATLGVLSPARSAERQVSFRLDLQAPAECPTADAFLGEILKRVPGARAAKPAESARSFRVSIQQKGARFVGTVESDSLTRTDQKVAEANTCKAVVDALAVAVALSLDSDESTPALPMNVPADAAPAAAPERAHPAQPPPPARTPPPTREWGVALDLSGLGEALPRMAGAEASLFWRSAGTDVVSPALRVGVETLTDFGSGRDVQLRSVLFTSSFCPARALVSRATVAICGRTLVGGLEGRARLRSSRSGAWLLLGASGGEARLELPLGRFLLEGHFAALGVWSRPRFRSEPSAEVLQATGGFMLDAGVGLGAFF